MPEGPSIVILKEELAGFKGKKILAASGNSKKIDLKRLKGQVILDLKTWGKNLFICFPTFTVRIHLMLFGSYRINEKKNAKPRLSLRFANNKSFQFYACVVQLLEEPLDELYDWSADVMNSEWDSRQALKKLRSQPDTMVCDALLDQAIFAGVGNIIKNEVLFITRIHPESIIGKIPAPKLRQLVKETVRYAFQFLEWKKEFTLRKHWLAHTKTTCPRDHIPFIKAWLGKTDRRSFFCPVCQKIYV